ncbi:ABC transporter substrate binding protein [Bradyrhizobium rifense]|uniref:ABC transporter substrate binding protein n=1 Tax=Bradyrhizobium rifense TaxID=515499 RepID=UPI001FEBB9CC|nr:ABC transporter substrate binding protein [Bradyrhizobium rifense]
MVADPIAFGIVSSLSRPGGNITGSTVDGGIEMIAKRLSLLLEAKPNARLGYLASRGNWNGVEGALIMGTARRASASLVHIDLGNSITEQAYVEAASKLAELNVNALLVSDEPDQIAHKEAAVAIATNARVPAMYAFRDLAEAGGLMAYCVDLPDAFRYAAKQIAEILHGKLPGDIPFFQPTFFPFIVNLKAARQIGFEFPHPLLARADEVIE